MVLYYIKIPSDGLSSLCIVESNCKYVLSTEIYYYKHRIMLILDVHVLSV